MKLYTFIVDGQERLGVEAADGRLIDLDAAQRLRGGKAFGPFSDMIAFIESGDAALHTARTLLDHAPDEALYDFASVALAPPIPRPRKIRAFSVYAQHLQQAVAGAGRIMAARDAKPDAPVDTKSELSGLNGLISPGWFETPGYYYSDCTAITATDSDVAWPDYSTWIDYELEIAAIIGRPGKDIAADQASDYIFGYSILNDLSARDAQFKAMATGLGVAKGKDFDRSNPFGPCIVTADEIPNPYALKLVIRVNDEIWTDTTSEGPHWSFGDCIAYASQAQTIYPGELFSTGCIANCCSMELMRTVRRGDRIEFDVEGIGVLRTRIV